MFYLYFFMKTIFFSFFMRKRIRNEWKCALNHQKLSKLLRYFESKLNEQICDFLGGVFPQTLIPSEPLQVVWNFIFKPIFLTQFIHFQHGFFHEYKLYPLKKPVLKMIKRLSLKISILACLNTTSPRGKNPPKRLSLSPSFSTRVL